MAPLTSSFSLVAVITVSKSSCLFSSTWHRDSISWKWAGCPRFGWRLWAFLSFNQKIQKSAGILTPLSWCQDQKVTGLSPLPIIAMARLICALTWVCEGPCVGRRVAEKAKWDMVGANSEGRERVSRASVQHNQGFSPMKSTASTSHGCKDQVDNHCLSQWPWPHGTQPTHPLHPTRSLLNAFFEEAVVPTLIFPLSGVPQPPPNNPKPGPSPSLILSSAYALHPGPLVLERKG